MLFNSWIFFAFALVVLPLYHALPLRWQNRMLLVASYVFYGTWDYRFLFLLLLTTSIDYFVACGMGRTDDPKKRKLLLGVTLVSNLSVLGFFKYFNFFSEQLEALLHTLGFNPQFFHLNVVLPVGISFFTLQTIGYVIDVYWKKIPAEQNFLDFALFISYFPQLVAGPIEQAGHLLPQIKKARPRVTFPDVASAAWLILLGYFKKSVVADNIAAAIDPMLAGPTPGGLSCLIISYLFTIQLYCDFAGYCDIARGVSKLMGINLMVNFNLPMIARNPVEYWNRWHISLSLWFRHYVYIPLGGNRGGVVKTLRNLMITFVLSGLWHGPKWSWITWGAYHGAWLCAYRLMFPNQKKQHHLHWALDLLCRTAWFNVIALGLMIIRTDTPTAFWNFIVSIFTRMSWKIEAAEPTFLLMVLGGSLFAIELWVRNRDNPWEAKGWNWGLGVVTVTLVILSLWFLPAPVGKPFIYFQF
ncbi:MBOAT family protein [Candidatus Sumerlaeota bacterium]|nr:MBOAT family protein [Candidatus Sumerlaeota bacterium]